MPRKEKEDKILEEVKRHNKVLMEHMDKQVKTVGEQHGSIIRKLGEHDRQFEKIHRRSDRVEIVVMENSSDIKKLKTVQERVERKLDTALTAHEERIKKIEEKVGT